MQTVKIRTSLIYPEYLIHRKIRELASYKNIPLAEARKIVRDNNQHINSNPLQNLAEFSYLSNNFPTSHPYSFLPSSLFSPLFPLYKSFSEILSNIPLTLTSSIHPPPPPLLHPLPIYLLSLHHHSPHSNLKMTLTALLLIIQLIQKLKRLQFIYLLLITLVSSFPSHFISLQTAEHLTIPMNQELYIIVTLFPPSPFPPLLPSPTISHLLSAEMITTLMIQF